MDDNAARLQTAQWILERNLAWIGAAEIKTGVVIAVDTAMLGALATAFAATGAAERTAWAYLFTVAAALMLAIGVWCASRAVLPELRGPKGSLIFFGGIADCGNYADYAERFHDCGTTALLDDFLAQIHRNAEIAREKFRWVRSSMLWSFIAISPWVAAICTLIEI